MKQTSRRLLTILAADVANFTKLVSENETGTLERLAELRSIMDPIIESHGGRIANTAGDSVLASFENPTSAVQAAILIQEKHGQSNSTVKTSDRVRFRIGINIGEVTQQPNGDILGHGVNVASRLETISEPGGICLAENVIEQVKGNLEYSFTKVGEHFVKNLDQPLKVYKVGEASIPAFEKATRKVQKWVRSQYFLPLLLAVVLISTAFSLFAVYSQRGDESKVFDTENLEDFLSLDPTAEELLEFFDLVTTGEFGDSKYYVIRTWGAEFPLLEQIAEVLGGHIVTITSQEENEFVYQLTLEDEGHWIFDGNLALGPLIGLVQDDDAIEPNGGWRWANEEALTFTNWKRGSPDNSSGNQDYANFQGPNVPKTSPTWNDTTIWKRSFILEVPNP
ncbi:adenylate/guanylate cyclase domain-containing protein [Ruegeria sp. AU67]|uniref:adenylate/guanylate cyclase domain-containing protein n=1 Tax=Ruegeria sp. AU67 TaxID=2108530 RepID=UPI00135A3D3B|nr:adenylate/guanylate cyclase domain-containing protein [Ruegeria sp. AU67]